MPSDERAIDARGLILKMDTRYPIRPAHQMASSLATEEGRLELARYLGQRDLIDQLKREYSI